MKKNIELTRYYKLFKKKAWIIALGVVLGGIISGLVTSQFIDPIYQAKTTIIIDTKTSTDTVEYDIYGNSKTQGQVTEGDINFSSKIAGTYMPILKSRKVIDKVISELKLNMSYEYLSQCITTTQVNQGQIIDIEVRSKDPKVSYDIANTLPEVFSSELKNLTKFDGVQVIDAAIMPNSQVYPNVQKNRMMGAVLGLAIAILVILIADYLDNKLKTPEDIEEYLDLPLLGVVISEDSNNSLIHKR